ncbi:MAG TPA: endolytic transglycosylase MltG [Ktedonobacterales bacterium]|nr:endolytic transglycosylase MltG [Ktedonobacterales bacterium]
MKRVALVVTILFALLAFGIGFVGTTVTLDITRPITDNSNATVRFVVNDGDTTTDVANNLEKAGLIRNALVFRLFARYKHLDTSIQHGIYDLSPGMTMDQIVTKLQMAIPDERLITVPPGMRVTQYPKYFSDLPSFNADNFMKIAQTGILLDDAKTPLSTKYWFVPKKGTDVKYALEGYLFPDTYYFDKTDDETKVIETMLDNLGEHLCPGPNNQPDAYLADKDQCKAYAVKVGDTDIFSAMKKAYSTKDDTDALHTALTFASLTVREIKDPNDAPGVTNVYYTRYMALLGKTPNTGLVGNLGSDPTTQYARDSEAPPKDGKWWTPLTQAATTIATKDPYNTYVTDTIPPGPIAAPLWADIVAAVNPSISKYFYFIQDCHGKTLYATTKDQHDANASKPCS